MAFEINFFVLMHFSYFVVDLCFMLVSEVSISFYIEIVITELSKTFIDVINSVEYHYCAPFVCGLDSYTTV